MVMIGTRQSHGIGTEEKSAEQPRVAKLLAQMAVRRESSGGGRHGCRQHIDGTLATGATQEVDVFKQRPGTKASQLPIDRGTHQDALVAETGEHRVEPGEPGTAAQKPMRPIKAQSKGGDARIGCRSVGIGGASYDGVDMGVGVQKQHPLRIRCDAGTGMKLQPSTGRRINHRRAVFSGESDRRIGASPVDDHDGRIRPGRTNMTQRDRKALRFVQCGNDDREMGHRNQGLEPAGAGFISMVRPENHAVAVRSVLSVSTMIATALITVASSPKQAR